MASVEFEALMRRFRAVPLRPMTAAERLADLRRRRQSLEMAAARMERPALVTAEDIADAPRPATLFRPPQARPGTILYLHGGAFVTGGRGSHGHLAAWLAELSARQVLLFDCPLVPEHAWPEPLEAAEAMVRWLSRRDQGPIALAGDSAGGFLALATALRTAPAAVAVLSPLVDAGVEIDPGRQSADPVLELGFLTWALEQVRERASAASPPLSLLEAELSTLPPTLIHAAGNEALAPSIAAFADRARSLGASVEAAFRPDLCHVWHWFVPAIPEARVALSEVACFLDWHMG